MTIDELPRAERERRFWQVWEARQRNGVPCTFDDRTALARDWQIETPPTRDPRE